MRPENVHDLLSTTEIHISFAFERKQNKKVKAETRMEMAEEQ